MAKLPYAVNFWGSHPDRDNDDCWMGNDYATLAEARKAFQTGNLCVGECDCKNGCRGVADCTVAFIELDGPGVNEVRANPSYSKRQQKLDDSWQREIAMEAGMLHGVDAYNDAMGY